MEVISEIHPINGGNTAPPTMDMTMKDEAFLVCGPKLLIPRAKMVGNMIDIKKKTPYNAIMDINPNFPLTTGSNTRHASEYTASSVVGFTKLIA